MIIKNENERADLVEAGKRLARILETLRKKLFPA